MLYEIHTGKKYQKVIDDAMAFIVQYLDLPENIWVDVYLKKLPKGSCGGCIDMELDEEYHYFEVDINNSLTRDEMITTLFHEMKHVEQTANCRLNQTFWCGVDYKDVEYLDRPWEKEAYEFESTAIHCYRRRNDL
jgi:hypothetical protein